MQLAERGARPSPLATPRRMPAPVYRFADYRLDPATGELHRGSGLATLPPRAFHGPAYRVERRDRAVGRDELIAAVWAMAEVSDTLPAQAMLRVRRAHGAALRLSPGTAYRNGDGECGGVDHCTGAVSGDGNGRRGLRAQPSRGLVRSRAAPPVIAGAPDDAEPIYRRAQTDSALEPRPRPARSAASPTTVRAPMASTCPRHRWRRPAQRWHSRCSTRAAIRSTRPNSTASTVPTARSTSRGPPGSFSTARVASERSLMIEIESITIEDECSIFWGRFE